MQRKLKRFVLISVTTIHILFSSYDSVIYYFFSDRFEITIGNVENIKLQIGGSRIFLRNESQLHSILVPFYYFPNEAINEKIPFHTLKDLNVIFVEKYSFFKFLNIIFSFLLFLASIFFSRSMKVYNP